MLSSLFNKGAGNSILEKKIEFIFKLLAGGNLKLPQIHQPEASTVSKKPIIHVKPDPSNIFILLPAPLLGKPIEIPPAQMTKLYYKPGSLHQILDSIRQSLPTPQKLSLPKLTPHTPVLPTNPIKCLPIFSKVPC